MTKTINKVLSSLFKKIKSRFIEIVRDLNGIKEATKKRRMSFIVTTEVRWDDSKLRKVENDGILSSDIIGNEIGVRWDC